MVLLIIPKTLLALLHAALKIIEHSIIRKLECGFLFAFHSNYGAILYRLRDIVSDLLVENADKTR